LLLGADRVKDVAILNAAYNDAAGYTAAFNLNVLSVLNEAVEADFELENFSHRAFYNAEEAQIEMHLESRVNQTVHLKWLGQSLQLASGETIRTEISRKFSRQSIAALLAAAGFEIEQHHGGPEGEFSLVLAAPAHA
jgi:L-histidine N-alpha-methyltransferase